MRGSDSRDERAALHLVEASGRARHVALDRPVLHVGRAHASCGLVLAGPEVAPHHCCLRQVGGRWWLFDRGSPAGTFINSMRCHEPTVLRDGDRISVGLHVLEFRGAPALDLAQVLARLGGEAPTLDFTGVAPPCATAPTRSRGPLRTAGLAAVVGFGVTLAIAADLAPQPADAAVSPDMFYRTGEHAPPAVVVPERHASTGELAADPTNMSLVPGEQARITDHAAASADRPLGPGEPQAITGPAAASATVAARIEYLAEPGFELPTDALARGRPDAGSLLRALQLPPSPDYTIRCPAHAYASSATVAELMRALAGFRNRSSYRGELVVGDLSRAEGGRYGPHRSHQSGRDVDLWLPIEGGRYRRGCTHCGTDLCRPEPDEVDWQATWELVAALAARGRVEDVFLAWDLQPALLAAARRLGAPEAALARQIQHPVRGRAALVKHAQGHTHHLHVRFRCPTGDDRCVAPR